MEQTTNGQLIDGQQAEPNEALSSSVNFMIVRGWDNTVESLQRQAGLETLVLQMGFDLPTLAATLNRKLPEELKLEEIHDKSTGKKIEDVSTETIIVNDRPLDRLLVIAYPPAAKAIPSEMTKFKLGGEVMFITEGEAEITYAQRETGGSIARSDLKTERVGRGDLILSTDTPNNWTSVIGDTFTFIYFVGNPNGPQRYNDIPKENITVT